jgi:hypothetical protein
MGNIELVQQATFRGDPAAAQTTSAVNGYEILDVSSGRADYVDELPDHGELITGEFELDVVARRGDDRPPLSSTTLHQWRAWVVLVLAFGLGLAAGSLPSQSGADASAEPKTLLVAGQASVNGAVDPDSGMVPLLVALRTAGTHDVEVLGGRPVGWPGQVGAARRAQTVSAGYWRNVSTAIRLDCGQVPPSAPTEIEVRIRTDAGDSSVIVPLPRPMRDLAEAWQAFCPAPSAAPQPRGSVP